jgi:hypothetical protein
MIGVTPPSGAMRRIRFAVPTIRLPPGSRDRDGAAELALAAGVRVLRKPGKRQP